MSLFRVKQRDGLQLFISFMKDTNIGIRDRGGYEVTTIAQLFNQAGHGNFISVASHEFSVISADNPNSPKQIPFNLPVNISRRVANLK